MRGRLLLLALGFALGFALAPGQVRAQANGLVISQLQTGGGTGHSGDEFIELHNLSDTAADAGGWNLQYHAASSSCDTGWTTKLTLPSGTLLPPGGFWLAAATGYGGADGRFSAGLADTGGTVRLRDSQGAVSDALAWGSGSCGSGTAAPAPADQSLIRIGTTADNAADFKVATPSPRTSASSAESTSMPPDPGPPVPSPSAPFDAVITELLPNPAPPGSQANDEFVELYHPGSGTLNLDGYTLRSGPKWGSKTSLSGLTLAPGEYLALYSAQTHLPLSNSGGQVGLFDAAGNLVGMAVIYPVATAGQAYAWTNDSWQWTTSPTPGAVNQLQAPPPKAVKAAAAKPAAKPVKPKATVKATTKAPKKSAAPKSSSPVLSAGILPSSASPSGRWLLFVLAGLTMAYIGYEFRYDLQNYLYRSRRYRAIGEALSRRFARRQRSGPDE